MSIMSKESTDCDIYVCTKCGRKREITEYEKLKRDKFISPILWCHKCQSYTTYKRIPFYKKEKETLRCNEIFGTNLAHMDNTLIKCTMKNNLSVIFKTVNDIVKFIVQNKLTNDSRDYILNQIQNVLNLKAQSVYGLRFSYVYLGLYDKYCFEPVGYCKLKGCYLSKMDEAEKNCASKLCKNFIAK